MQEEQLSGTSLSNLKPAKALRLEISSQIRRIPGFVFGLQQPSIVVRLSVSNGEAAGYAALQQAMASIIEEPLPMILGDAPADERVARCVAFGACAILRQSRVPVSERFVVRRMRPASENSSTFLLILPAPRLAMLRDALDWVQSVAEKLMVPESAALDPESESSLAHERFKQYANPSLNAFHIAMAAYRLDVPLTFLEGGTFVLGTGICARWMESTVTDETPSISMKLARRKDLTASLLRRAGLPGASNMLVDSAKAAVEAAAHLGYPVVVKPADQDRGIGVEADLVDDQSVVSAYDAARKVSRRVLVEKWVEGYTHRLTIYRGDLVRVTRRIAGGVVGDGESTIAHLVERYQATDMQRAMTRRMGKVLLELDDEAIGLLDRFGLTVDTVPGAGEYVRLRRRDNISAGGDNEYLDLSDAHPDNVELARTAAALLRLDFAGIDYISPDIGRSWLEVGGVICEVNGQPQLGVDRDSTLYEELLEKIMRGRYGVPARLYLCPSDRAELRRVLELVLSQGNSHGVSCRDGLWLAGRRESRSFPSGFSAAQALMLRPNLESATCIVSMKEIVSYGSPLPRWDRIDVDAPDSFSNAELAAARRLRVQLRDACPTTELNGLYRDDWRIIK